MVDFFAPWLSLNQLINKTKNYIIISDNIMNKQPPLIHKKTGSKSKTHHLSLEITPLLPCNPYTMILQIICWILIFRFSELNIQRSAPPRKRWSLSYPALCSKWQNSNYHTVRWIGVQWVPVKSFLISTLYLNDFPINLWFEIIQFIIPGTVSVKELHKLTTTVRNTD